MRGLTSIKLPLRGNLENPPFVILDSCWGSEKIVSGGFEIVDSIASNVVVLINPNPMGKASLDYRALNYFQLLAIPFIYVDKVSSTNSRYDSAFMKQSINKYLQETGLQGDTNYRTDIALTLSGHQKESLKEKISSLGRVQIRVVKHGEEVANR